jgi:hypothetical protein
MHKGRKSKPRAPGTRGGNPDPGPQAQGVAVQAQGPSHKERQLSFFRVFWVIASSGLNSLKERPHSLGSFSLA